MKATPSARRTAAVLLVLLLGCVVPAFAAEYFVDFAAGSDANSGTAQAAPWKHAPGDAAATGLPAAVALHAGDIVTFHGGVIYPDGLTLAASGTAAAHITYRGDAWGASPAIIDGGHTVSIGIYLNGNYLTVEGFEIRNVVENGIRHDLSGNGTGLSIVGNKIHDTASFPTASPDLHGDAMYMRYTAGLLIQNDEHYSSGGDTLRVFDSTDAVIRNNNFHDGAVDGIKGGSNNTFTIDHNTLHGFQNITTHGDATQIMQGDRVVVSNNLVYDCTQNIYFDTYLSGMTDVYIFNNVVVNTVPGTDGQGGWYNGIVIDNRYHPIGSRYVYENTVVNENTGSGGFTNMSASGNLIGTLSIRNNVFYNSINNVDTTTVTNLTMDYNDYYDTFQGWVFMVGHLTLAQFKAAHPTLELHSMTLDPKLDASNLYALLAGSPAIDHGMSLAAVNGTSFATDFADATRPAGAAWDMGAFESGAAAGATGAGGANWSARRALKGRWAAARAPARAPIRAPPAPRPVSPRPAGRPPP